MIESDFETTYPGLKLEKIDKNTWTINIPKEFKIGHEEHFGEVTKKYLEYLKKGNIPEWEIPNMIVKYYTTSQASEMANKK